MIPSSASNNVDMFLFGRYSSENTKTDYVNLIVIHLHETKYTSL